MLMADIETDLLLANLPLLDRTYEGETPEQHEARLARYANAYKKFDAELAKFMTDVNGNVRAGQRSALQAKEQEAKSLEQTELNSIASAFA